MAATITTGVAITFASGFCAEILNIDGNGIGERDAIDTTHMGTTNSRTFSPSTLRNSGEWAVELHFIPGTTPPWGDAAETITVTFPDAGAATWAASGFMQNFDIKGPLEDKMTATATLKLSGDITVTP